jgi:hypothetical protein
MARQRSRKTQAYGFTFDSNPEFARYLDLRGLQADGVISGLIVHPLFELKPRIVVKANGIHKGYVQARETYTADFSYLLGSHVVVEDVKALVKGKPYVMTAARNKHKALIAIWHTQNALVSKSLILVCQDGNDWMYFDSNSNPISPLMFYKQVENAA